MPDTINLPGVGPTNKKTVYLVGGLIVVVAGYGYYRSRNASVAPTPSDTTATDITATDSTYDPTLDPTSQYYDMTSDPNSAYYQGGVYDSGMSQYPIGAGLYEPVTAPTGYTSNPEWSQAAEDYLANSVGLSPTNVQAALGKYLTGGTVNDAQESIINQAIAAVGYPPQAGPNGYPPSIKKSAAPSVTTLATPHMASHWQGKGKAKEAILVWSKIPHAAHYTVYNHGQFAFNSLKPTAVVHRSGLYSVAAIPADNRYRASAKSNAVTINF